MTTTTTTTLLARCCVLVICLVGHGTNGFLPLRKSSNSKLLPLTTTCTSKRRLLLLPLSAHNNNKRTTTTTTTEFAEETISSVTKTEPRAAVAATTPPASPLLYSDTTSTPTTLASSQQQQQTAATAASDKQRILVVLWTIACLSALDRVAMSVAMVPLTELLYDNGDMVWTDGVKGTVSSVFSVGYGIGILPAGILVMSQSPRIVMAGGILVWSLATMATPWGIHMMSSSSSTSMSSTTDSTLALVPLLALRVAVGLGESIVIPTMQRTLSVWTNENEKSRALAWVFSGFAGGTVLAYTISPMILEAADWSGLFYLYGGLGLLILVPWLLVAKDAPPTATAVSKESSVEQEPLPVATSNNTANQNLDTVIESFQSAPWKQFASSPGVWGMLFAHAAKNWGLYINLAWTPTFYAEQYGLSVADSALLSVGPSLAGAAGAFVAGWTADAVLERFDIPDPTPVRKVFQGIALLGPAVALGGLAWHIPESAVTAQWFLMASVGLQSFNAAGFEAGNQEKAGPKWSGLLYSVTTLPAVWFATFGVWLTGQVLDVTEQDWSVVFALNAGINVLGALAFISLFNSRREFE